MWTSIKWFWLYRFVSLLLGTVGIFFSAWIFIPAPIFSLLPLSVGAPEISPWLIVGNFITIFIAAVGYRPNGPGRTALILSVLSLVMSAWPLSQLPAVTQQAETALSQALGANYLDQVPAPVLSQMRSQPFVLEDLFRGIPGQPVRYTAGIPFAKPDSVSLTIDLYQPSQPGIYPGVVMIYGGAWQRGAPAQNAEFGRYLAARGYVVWAIDYRHAPQYKFPAQIQDVRSALQFIQQHAGEYETDRHRLAVMGRSAGAHLALLAAYDSDRSKSTPFRAVVDYYGPVDLTAGYYDLPQPDPIDSRAVLKAFLGGTPKELGALYHQASPAEYVTRSLPPTLLIYGGHDHIVRAKFGRGLDNLLKAKGNQAAFIEIPWADHAFDEVFAGVSNQVALYYTERFLAWALMKN